MEIWKDIKGYDDYKASSFGRIKSIKNSRELILKGCKDKDGYIVSSFRVNGIKKTLRFHRLVAIAFHENNLNLPQVNHLDGNKENNDPNNLEWATALSNNIHAIKTGLREGVKGAKNNFYGKKGQHNVKSRKIINTKTNQTFNSIKEASDLFGIKYNVLCKNLNGQNLNKTDFKYFNL